MRFLQIAGGMLLSLVIAGCQASPPPKPPSAQPEQAASDAVGVLRKLVNETNYKAMGFDSADQVQQAQLGAPMTVSEVGLDQLKAYQPQTDPATLLSTTSETVYPVTVNGVVKSSVTIVRTEAGYRPSSFGNAAVVQALSKFRQDQTAGGDFIVRAPALNLWFLGRRVDNRLLLIAVDEDPRLQLRPGEPTPAETVFAQLVPLANAYNGLPE